MGGFVFEGMEDETVVEKVGRVLPARLEAVDVCNVVRHSGAR